MSASPPPEDKPYNDPIKKKKKSRKAVEGHAPRNEGKDSNWAFNPPSQYVLADHAVDSGELDWDAVKDDEDIELWLIRAPEDLKPRQLENVVLKTPSSMGCERIGTLSRHQATYELWSIGQVGENHVGGEETLGMSCLLPRRKKHGKLYKASKPFSRHIVFSPRPPTPNSIAPERAGDPALKHQSPPRFSYPEEMLKHFFMPNGSEYVKTVAPSTQGVAGEMIKGIEVDQKERKRKGHPDRPKKPKKAKFSS